MENFYWKADPASIKKSTVVIVLPFRDQEWVSNLEPLAFGVLKIFTVGVMIVYILQSINKVDSVLFLKRTQVNLFVNRQSLQNKGSARPFEFFLRFVLLL